MIKVLIWLHFKFIQCLKLGEHFNIKLAITIFLQIKKCIISSVIQIFLWPFPKEKLSFQTLSTGGKFEIDKMLPMGTLLSDSF